AMGGDPQGDHARLEAALGDAYEQGLIADAAIATSDAQRNQMWAMRDDVVQTFRFAPIFTFDVSMRISKMEAYVDEVNKRLKARYPDCKNFIFGHMGDGNLHLVVSVGPNGRDEKEHVERAVYEPLVAIAGSVSAEHGVGLDKKPYLELCRSEPEIALMRSLKRSLDPKGILNPGKIFDAVVSA
ncbi:MAG: FAD-binding oxidoreductase, partial [Gammaproteobacteria bacterium]|nr:FAD-binding oxidoreductase [Gammaproteobacteria bacterium]